MAHSATGANGGLAVSTSEIWRVTLRALLVVLALLGLVKLSETPREQSVISDAIISQ